jgi:oligopeptide transport system substrate-binding protein
MPGEQISLRRNPFYWDLSHVRTPKITYVFTSDEGAALREFLAGQLDITDSVPLSALSWISRQKPAELHIWSFLGTAYYAVNLRDPRIHMNLKLREAMAMAIDRKMLVSRVLRFGQTPAYSFVPPGTWNYTQQPWSWQILPDKERIALARKLYREAGYSPDHPLHLRLLINTNSTIKETAIAIASMWKSVLGIRTEIDEQEYRVFLQSRHDPTQWDVARLGWTADYDDASDFLDIFRTNSPNNDSGYSSSAFTALMNLAGRTADSAARRQTLEAAERVMLSDYPVIPIYFYASDRLVKPYIGGFHPTRMNRLYSKYLYFRRHTSRSERIHEASKAEIRH